MPDFRTEKYTVWKACERFGILPPGIKSKFELNNLENQCALMAYDQIRTVEDAKNEAERIAAIFGNSKAAR